MLNAAKSQFRRGRAAALRRRLAQRAAPWPAAVGSAMVIAPHPDDETFGCGGLIAQRRAAGHAVHIVFLTDGEQSLRAHTDILPATVAASRRAHATAAAGKLGVATAALTFLGLPDGALPRAGAAGFDAAVSAVAEAIHAADATEVFTTHPDEGWRDHTAAAEIAAAAAGRRRLYHYCVWLWHNVGYRQFPDLDRLPVHRVDIADVQAQKQAAIDCFFAETANADGVPWCGSLPSELMAAVTAADEFFFAAPTVAAACE
jgi:LmbE family N-acetylglucosaminyl deacetylase